MCCVFIPYPPKSRSHISPISSSRFKLTASLGVTTNLLVRGAIPRLARCSTWLLSPKSSHHDIFLAAHPRTKYMYKDDPWKFTLSSFEVDLVLPFEPKTISFEMRSTSRCAVCWTRVTLLAPPDPASGGLGRARRVQSGAYVLKSDVWSNGLKFPINTTFKDTFQSACFRKDCHNSHTVRVSCDLRWLGRWSACRSISISWVQVSPNACS